MCAFKRSWVPSSSTPISHEYPATSAARIAARRRVWVMLLRQQPTAGQIGTVRDAQGFGTGLPKVRQPGLASAVAQRFLALRVAAPDGRGTTLETDAAEQRSEAAPLPFAALPT